MTSRKATLGSCGGLIFTVCLAAPSLAIPAPAAIEVPLLSKPATVRPQRSETLQQPSSNPETKTTPPITPPSGQEKPAIAPGEADLELSSVSAYLLGPGDAIDLRVFGYEEYAGEQVILPDGSIVLPVIGRIVAAGQTPGQLTQEITKRLRPLLVEQPVVTIRVLRLRPLLVTVAGEVQRPGPLQLSGLASLSASAGGGRAGMPTISEAIFQAGGITRTADIRGIVLRRIKPSGEAVSVTLNLWESLKSAGGPPDILLRDGDYVFIPKARVAGEFDPKLLARSTLAPRTVKVRVVGEVKSPGEKEVAPNSSISTALAIAGGATDKANLAAVSYVRLNENGTAERRGIDLSNLSDTEQVQDGDMVIVPKTDISSALDVFSQVINPLLLLRIFN